MTSPRPLPDDQVVHRKNGEVTGRPLFSVDKETWFSTEELAIATWWRKKDHFEREHNAGNSRKKRQ